MAEQPPQDAGEGEGEGIHLIVIGAGLAGLAAALSTKLANPRHRVTVCEAVRELQEVGVCSLLPSLPPYPPEEQRRRGKGC